MTRSRLLALFMLAAILAVALTAASAEYLGDRAFRVSLESCQTLAAAFLGVVGTLLFDRYGIRATADRRASQSSRDR